MLGGEGQNEGSRDAESAMCRLCNEQALMPDYVWILLEGHVSIPCMYWGFQFEQQETESVEQGGKEKEFLFFKKEFHFINVDFDMSVWYLGDFV